ncbi:MAG: hypothetical protein SH856_00195 [Flavobacteriales bacterium]|nr:hypothetical protein [Flavobacteriales bacterium]
MVRERVEYFFSPKDGYSINIFYLADKMMAIDPSHELNYQNDFLLKIYSQSAESALLQMIPWSAIKHIGFSTQTKQNWPLLKFAYGR